ncbi:MAG TPA: type II toxin-antitoxin system RelE/ParE family toxin [Kiritimatiellia bacterium]|nr:type II toxin-antitoxin system RelE/ParE family toxin [Kiritimatiellia bacterium]HMP00697.1 type II toxin-antitoxin system RelE/ParE family toxin [Kiritimatiellia bacterium]HMP91095.1 type II toxin-antitoxin system RelE/ParE family toxin [Kiritimatiellia bacterium]
MTYTVRLAVPVQKALDRIDPAARRRIIRHLEALEENPRPVGVVKLAGAYDLYRVRVGDWRIVYSIRDRELLVLVVKIGNRRDVYRARYN